MHNHEDRRTPHAGIAVIMEPSIFRQLFVKLDKAIHIRIIGTEVIHQRETEILRTMCTNDLFLRANLLIRERDRSQDDVLRIIIAEDANLRFVSKAGELLLLERQDDLLRASIVAPVMVRKPGNRRAVKITMGLTAQINVIELLGLHGNSFQNRLKFLLGETARSRRIHRRHSFATRNNACLSHPLVVIFTHTEVAW